MDGSATRSLEDRGLNGMLVNWLYLPSCTISRGDGSTEEESRIVRVAILEFPRLLLFRDPFPAVRDGDKSIPPYFKDWLPDCGGERQKYSGFRIRPEINHQP
jgi:hypothetical protein